jgi:eukaryotic-like serine/threonine-protein kinase
MSDAMERLNAALSGRYRVDRQLGEGGMATVYLADDLRHGRRVALKVLKPELAAVVGADRFLAEIKTTANLQHPHILPLFDSGEASGFLFYVMPYVEGESLRQRLDREHQLPVEVAVGIATSVAEALDYAHRRGVIHRDIKPANILLQDGNPVISDFGIARAVTAGGAGRLTETGLSLGTPHYMSPEQATGDQAVHAATDIYALGCVLYEMLVGEPPYTGSSAQAILGKIIQAKPVSATEARRSVPAHVDAVVRKALEKLAADRFATAREMAAALDDRSFRHGEVPTLEGAGGDGAPRRVAAVAVLASLVTGASVWRATSRSSTEAAPVVRLAVPLPAGSMLRGNTVQPLGLTSDGRAVVLNVTTGDQSQSRLFVRSLDNLEAIPVRGTEDVGSLFLSPDGSSVAFYSVADNTLKRVPLTGGVASTVSETGLRAGGMQGAAWGAGRIVFSTSVSSGLMQVRELGGAPEPLTRIPEGATESHWSPHLLPGDQRLLFEIRRQGEQPEIAVLVMSSGEYEVLTSGSHPQYVEGGFLVLLRGTALWAARFDASRGTLQGDPVPVLEGVQGARRYFAVSPGGSLVYAPQTEESGVPRRLVWVDRGGRGVGPAHRRQPYVYPRLSPAGDRLAVAVPDDVLA